VLARGDPLHLGFRHDGHAPRAASCGDAGDLASHLRIHDGDVVGRSVGDVEHAAIGRESRTPRALAPVAAALGRQALHAAVLELDHPVTGARLRFESPLPSDLATALSCLRER